MNSWKTFSQSVTQAASQAAGAVGGAASSVDLQSTGNKLSRSFQTFSQTVKERTGGVSADDITELPQEYLELERRVDGLRAAHQNLLKVAKSYEGAYDYPVHINESVNEITGSLAHNLSSWAAAATKGTNLPQPSVAQKPAEVQKTLPHALSRAAASGAVDVGPGRLANVLKTYAVVQDKVGSARNIQDEEITKNFLQPWSATLNSSLQAAMKSRQAVKNARIQLDALRGTLKSATGGPKQEQVRLEVEAAEEKLVTATEEAINLMRQVLDNPEPIRNLNSLVRAQQQFHAEAAEALASVQAEFEEAAVQAEAEYRKSRAQ
ncbi:hypothetical protein ACM66B_000623 [Microbotryomycetes sp. NB124-2]